MAAPTIRLPELTLSGREPDGSRLFCSCPDLLGWFFLFQNLQIMQRTLAPLLFLVCTLAQAAELRLDFSKNAPGKPPAGFTNLLAGEGILGEWKVIMDEVPPLMAPLTPQAPTVTKRAVLGQLSKDPTDERFPMLVYENETFGDFTLATRFKIVSGQSEQMAGIAFRLEDERNFYVIRASALGKNVRFYKVVEGLRSSPIGPELEIKPNQWYELEIQCSGNEIRCKLNSREVFPPLTDSSFRSGKIAFWTKSDSVSYFADTRITYTPRVPLGQQIVNGVMEEQSRLVGLKIYVQDGTNDTTHIIASDNLTEVGQVGGKYELAAMQGGEMFYSKSSGYAAVVMPLRDRNGDIVAAARVHMATFPGQTQRNALIRATPIVKSLEARMNATSEPLQ